MSTLAAWEAGCANQGKSESCGVAVPVKGIGASLMDTEEDARVTILSGTALVYVCGLGMTPY